VRRLRIELDLLTPAERRDLANALPSTVAAYVEHSTHGGLPSWPAAVRSTNCRNRPRDSSALPPRRLRVARPDPPPAVSRARYFAGASRISPPYADAGPSVCNRQSSLAPAARRLCGARRIRKRSAQDRLGPAPERTFSCSRRALDGLTSMDPISETPEQRGSGESWLNDGGTVPWSATPRRPVGHLNTESQTRMEALPMTEQRRLSVKEAAARAGVSVKTVRRKIAAGALAGYKVRGTSKVVVLEGDVDAVFALEPIEPRPQNAPASTPKRSRRQAGRGSRAALRTIEAERG
jgi:excisionase family DNA binding protein